MSPQIQDLDMQGYSIIRLGTGMLSRTITGTADEIAVSNGDGVSGNPTISIAQAFKDSVSQGWNAFGIGSGVAAISYNSATVFNTSIDFTSYVGVGDKIKITQASGTKYFYVIAITASTITTATNSDYSIANELVLSSFFSHDENPVGFPDWFNYSASVTGFSANPTSTVYRFKVSGRTCKMFISMIQGTSNTTAFTISLPITAKTLSNATWGAPCRHAVDNSSDLTSPARVDITSGATTAAIYKTVGGTAWTSSGTKGAEFTVDYEI